MLFYLIFAMTLASDTLNQTQPKTSNFDRQDLSDAYRSGRYLGDKVQPGALIYCSREDYDSNSETDRKFSITVRLYIRIHPSYYIYRDESGLPNDYFGFTWLPIKDWERFDYIKVGDPRFSPLWKNGENFCVTEAEKKL